MLNYKSLPYTTHWLEYPEIAPFLSQLVPPNEPPANAPYTVPAARFPDGGYLMNSVAISQRLNKDYPDPPLHLDTPYHKKVIELLSKFTEELEAVYIPAVPRELLNPPSAEYFYRTRQEMVGAPLPDFEKSDKGGENAWKAAEPHIRELAGLYRENSGGPFVLGKDVSYVDFVLVAWLKLFDCIGKLEDLKRWGGEELLILYDASRQWLEREERQLLN